MMTTEHKPQAAAEPRKMTVQLPPDLAAQLDAERARLEREAGVKVSANQAAIRALRAGLGT